MEDFSEKKEYLEELKKRSKQSHVYHKHQLIGLELADILSDREHKSLYIKLAKETGDTDRLIQVAKEVAERRDIKKPGAYFMRIIKDDGGKNS
ncbi:MAG: hypothetical protein COU09_01015 [Candidatus Harrisonbacteria bacterium CG10_big_fil_rev_8_21_14_0_10_44_23]|uniref:Uncharacterized protein n=1 Tax=Candidatus Harrisonbacteria bacterium CG10_big_fil_rev_8_21_14_0_10_44_23 TaxID=1974585 RepID=A0A2H0USM0_9BACT|nr:MAG: hypothetical protein COU09_01015 [Candidatus Harrisonbacteria bacterium CG10_big_fil_rev_8_21_14_0_10_44_23]